MNGQYFAMKIVVVRSDILNMIKGLPIAMGGNAYTEFTGNQHNPDWGWVMSKFKDMTLSELFETYLLLKGKS
jgi:hypothetical protein